MHLPRRMGGRETSTCVEHDCGDLVPTSLLVEPVARRSPRYLSHGHVDQAPLHTDIVDFYDVGVVEPGQNPGFSHESSFAGERARVVLAWGVVAVFRARVGLEALQGHAPG